MKGNLTGHLYLELENVINHLRTEYLENQIDQDKKFVAGRADSGQNLGGLNQVFYKLGIKKMSYTTGFY